MTDTGPKHSPAPWGYEYSPYTVRNAGTHGDKQVGDDIAAYEIFDADGNKVFDTNEDAPAEQQEANARLGAAALKLLAYAECEAAVACGRADPRFDPKQVLRSHGWSEKTEGISLFLSRIRREALETATGSYLGRSA